MRSDQIEKWNFRWISHVAYFFSSVTNRKNFRRISGHNRVGGNIFRHHAAGADDGVFADRDVAKNRRAGTDRCALADARLLDFPVRFGLQAAVGGRRPRDRCR